MSDSKQCVLGLVGLVKSGKIHYDIWRCSVCNRTHENVNEAYSFCPKCGKKVLMHTRGEFEVVDLDTTKDDAESAKSVTYPPVKFDKTDYTEPYIANGEVPDWYWCRSRRGY